MTMLTETSMFDFRIKVTHFFYLIIKIIVSQATELFISQRKYVAKNTYLSPHKGQFSLPTTKDAPPPTPPPPPPPADWCRGEDIFVIFYENKFC